MFNSNSSTPYPWHAAFPVAHNQNDLGVGRYAFPLGNVHVPSKAGKKTSSQLIITKATHIFKGAFGLSESLDETFAQSSFAKQYHPSNRQSKESICGLIRLLTLICTKATFGNLKF